jgi:glycosyltransferase involved in cell wall biosynthesis
MAPTITHVVSSLQTGGAEKFVVNLALQQHRSGQRVSVFSYGSDGDALREPLAAAGVPVSSAGQRRGSRRQQVRALAQADIVHIHSPAVIRALAPVFTLLRRTRVVYTIHGEVDPPQSLLRATHQLARLYVDACTAVSELARQSVRRRYGWDPATVQVVRNGIVPPAAPLPLSDDGRLRLGCVSRLVPLKNIPLLFDAIEQLSAEARARLDITIIGDGPEREHIAARAAALAGPRIELTGALGDEQDIYRRFDVLVNCSDTEGLPMSVIEAMAWARPVVATAVGALPDAIAEGESGWLYPPRDADALAGILAHLLEDPARVHDAGKRARSEALARYSIDAVAAQFDDLYRRLAGAT